MSALRAIYEHGVFRPLEAVNLPECSEVLIEPRLVAGPISQPAGNASIRSSGSGSTPASTTSPPGMTNTSPEQL